MTHRVEPAGPEPQSVSLVYTSSAGALFAGWSRLDPCRTSGRGRYLRRRAEATPAPSSPGWPGSVLPGPVSSFTVGPWTPDGSTECCP